MSGASDKLYAWFLELLPPEAKDSFPQQAFMGMIMRTPPDAATIDLGKKRTGEDRIPGPRLYVSRSTWALVENWT